MAIRRIQRGRNHSYTIDGRKAMGVTTALSNGMPKPNLVPWAARTVAEEVADMAPADLDTLRRLGRDAMVAALKTAPDRQRNAAATRGTKVHHLAEGLIHGAEVEVPDDLLGHVESCVRFMDEWQVKPLLVERPIGSYRYEYAGTFDFIAEIPDGRRILFDYKTSKSGIFPETALQLAAYRFADAYLADDGETEIPLSEVGIDECKAVWIRSDGYDVIPLTCDENVFKSFLAVLTVARSRDRMPAWIGPAERPINLEETLW